MEDRELILLQEVHANGQVFAKGALVKASALGLTEKQVEALFASQAVANYQPSAEAEAESELAHLREAVAAMQAENAALHEENAVLKAAQPVAKPLANGADRHRQKADAAK